MAPAEMKSSGNKATRRMALKYENILLKAVIFMSGLGFAFFFLFPFCKLICTGNTTE
jgi:Sec-independent protein secretion pathway component TatC